MLCLEFFNLVRGRLVQTCFQSGKLSLVSLLHCFLPLFVLSSQFLKSIAAIRLEQLNLLLEVGNDLAMVLHQLRFLIAELLLKLNYLLFKLIDALLELHLDKLFVATRIVFELIEHTLVLLLELFKLASMLFCQVGLQLFVLLLCLHLVRL